MDNNLQSKLDNYINTLYAAEDETLAWIQEETIRNDMPQISIQPYDGRLLQILIYLNGAKKVVEIGTLAGYSGVWIARALPADGRLYTIDVSSKHAAVAKASFDKAGLNGKVRQYQGEAAAILPKITPAGPFDAVFIDANKDSYPAYLEWAIENVRVGGFIAAHNAFQGGRIIAPEHHADEAMHTYNETIAQDSRVESTIIGIGDGLSVAVRVR